MSRAVAHLGKIADGTAQKMIEQRRWKKALEEIRDIAYASAFDGDRFYARLAQAALDGDNAPTVRRR